MLAVREPSFVSPSEGRKCKVFVSSATIKISSESTNGAYSVTEFVDPPGAFAPPHVHKRELETFVVLEGEYEFQCGDRKFRTTQGGMVVLPKEIPHSLKNVGNTTGRTLIVLVPGGMEKVFEELDSMPPGPPDIGKINEVTMKYGVEFLPMG